MRRARGHQGQAAMLFRERQRGTDRIFATNEHDEPIEPKRDAAMRRRAEAQCAQQMAKERLSIFGPDAKRFEHFLLQFRLMNTHAAPANLDTVENDVVGFSANFTKLLRIE